MTLLGVWITLLFLLFLGLLRNGVVVLAGDPSMSTQVDWGYRMHQGYGYDAKQSIGETSVILQL